MTNILNILYYIFRVKILIILGLYFYSIIDDQPIFLFTTCYNWNDRTDTCEFTPLKIALLLILFAQDVVFSYKASIAVCAPVFYTVSFLLFLFILSVHCNVYLDITTLAYNFFLFITSCFTHNEYDTIHETKTKKKNQRTNDDYPDVEIRRFTKKKPYTVYYQAIDEV